MNGVDKNINMEDNPEILIKSYEKMIADDLKRIEDEGGADTAHLKACLYEKWVPELLDTISMLCKTTCELEQVSANAVIQLDHKLQESASTARSFMQRSAEMESYYSTSPLSNYTHYDMNGLNNTNYENESKTNSSSLVSLQTQLTSTQKLLDESRTLCKILQEKVDKLEEKLIKKETQIETLLRKQPSEDDKNNFKGQLIEKNIELQKAVAQKRLFEKRASDREDKIKALTLEVASKHDVVCQLEEKLRQIQVRDDQHQMQLNYQAMLLEALRKEVKKYKKPEHNHNCTDIQEVNLLHQEQQQKQELSLKCQAADNLKNKSHQEQIVLERRLEELETMLHAKDEMIRQMSAENRSQPLTTMIEQMSPDELKKALINKEKQMEEQKTLICQLQDALVASKSKLDDLNRPTTEAELSGASKRQSKDEIIKELNDELNELRHQYSSCFDEVCKQNQQMMLLRLACHHHHERANKLSKELDVRNSSNNKNSSLCFSYKQQIDHELKEELKKAKVELNKSEIKNSELEEEIKNMKENKLIEEILILQTCVYDGGKLLCDKDCQINILQEKLDEMCKEYEQQLKLMMERDKQLKLLSFSLDNITHERDVLLIKINQLSTRHDALKQKYDINIKNKEKKLEELKNEIKYTQGSIDEIKILKEQVKEKEKEVKSLQLVCKNHEKTINELENKIEEQIKFEETISKFKEENNKLINDITEYEIKMKNNNELLNMSCGNVVELEKTNEELLLKLVIMEDKVDKLNLEIEESKRNKFNEIVIVRKDIEEISRENIELNEQLKKSELEVIECNNRLGEFETELMLNTEKLSQYQLILCELQIEKQKLKDDLNKLNEDKEKEKDIISKLNLQLQSVTIEKEQLERSQGQLQELCKSLTTQLGGQKTERDRVVRGLKQAAIERNRLCQDARQVLIVARQWLAEHRETTLELRQLRNERDHLIKENASLKNRRHCSTSLLNPWDCGLVDREESGFWSSHWGGGGGGGGIQEENGADDEWIDQVDDIDEEQTGNGTYHNNDTGYQSAGSSK